MIEKNGLNLSRWEIWFVIAVIDIPKSLILVSVAPAIRP
jgi:hypothetical protein